MKILLVNNNTHHLDALLKSLAGHDVEVQRYRPGLEFHHQDKKLVILSGGGGEGLEIDDIDHQGNLWYADEMRFVRSCEKPIIGICMGFEVMAKAYGKGVPHIGKIIHRTDIATTTEEGWRLLGKHKLNQFESHGYVVPEAPDGFEVLAKSGTGVEMMRKDRQIGMQFHPELGGTLSLGKFLNLAA